MAHKKMLKITNHLDPTSVLACDNLTDLYNINDPTCCTRKTASGKLYCCRFKTAGGKRPIHDFPVLFVVYIVLGMQVWVFTPKYQISDGYYNIPIYGIYKGLIYTIIDLTIFVIEVYLHFDYTFRNYL